VEHQFAFYPQHRESRLNDRCTFLSKFCCRLV